MTKPEVFRCGKASDAPQPYHYKECGLDNIFLANGFDIETVDNEDYVSIHNVDGLWKAIGINIVADRKAFTPQEVRFLRRQMNLSQAELAAMLRVEDQTVARWEKKQCKMPGPADLALRFLFLSSPVAQPQGAKILSHFHDEINRIVKTDDTDDVGSFVFSIPRKKDAWEGRLAHVG